MENTLDSKLKEKNKQRGEKRQVEQKKRGAWTLVEEREQNVFTLAFNADRTSNFSSWCVDECDHRKGEIESTLAAENTRLRRELDRNRQQPAILIKQQSAQVVIHHRDII